MSKYCTDCKHGMREIRGPIAYIPARCAHPDVRSLVTKRASFAHIERGPGGSCGFDARLFEPKPPKSARKWWEFWR